jgi:hypothetical protein
MLLCRRELQQMEKLGFEGIVSLNPQILRRYLAKIFPDGLEYSSFGPDENIEEMQAILFSFIDSNLYFDEIYEIASSLNESYELINLLLMSNNYQFTLTVYDQLESEGTGGAGSQRGMIPILIQEPHQFRIPIMVTNIGDMLILFDDEHGHHSLADQCFITLDNNDSNKSRRAYRTIPSFQFGYHEIQFHSILSSSQLYSITNSILFTSSSCYSYCLSLDSCLDHLTWGWLGDWTESLESSILELLISVNDDLVEVLLNMRSMFSGILSSGVDDLEEMLKIIQEDLRIILTTRSNYSLGRLHQTFLQFLEMNEGIAASFMRIPPQFIRAIEIFYQAKILAMPSKPLLAQIQQLVRSLLLLLLPSSP